MLENIEVLTHSSIRISKNKIIYIDPFNIEKNYNDADLIFITHDHYDHYSEEDIDKVKKDDTVFIVPEDKEAARLINEIKPKIAVPIHYSSIVGTKQDATDFVKLLHPSIMSHSSKNGDIGKLSNEYSSIIRTFDI